MTSISLDPGDIKMDKTTLVLCIITEEDRVMNRLEYNVDNAVAQ